MNIKFNNKLKLKCPCCGEEYIRHTGVKVFSRKEDDEYTSVTKVECDGEINHRLLLSNLTNNPSKRREGLIIKFFCEICQSTFSLAISQHKGNTFFEWYKDVLYDNKNVEIHCDDILKGIEQGEYEGIEGVVVFDDGTETFQLINCYELYILTPTNCHNFEIIGNKKDNPNTFDCLMHRDY